MRNRTRVKPRELPFSVEEHYGGPVKTITGTRPVTANYESFSDLKGRENYNDCFHTLYASRFFPKTFSEIYRDPNIYAIYSNYVMSSGNVNLRPAYPLPKNGIAQFVLRGVQNIRPKFRAKVSVPNFLFELRDIRRLIPNPSQIARYAATLQDFVANGFRNFRTHADTAADAVAGQYLNAKFGYLPLINDIFNIIEAVDTFNASLDVFLKKGRKPQVSHYKEVIPATSSTPIVSHNGAYYSIKTQCFYDSMEYVFTMKYNYVVDLPKIHLPRLLQKYKGFRSNPRILWDAIPFSFVIDWFLRIGKALESFDQGAIPVKLNILQAGYSYHFRGRKQSRATAKTYTWPRYTFGSDWLFLEEEWHDYGRTGIDLWSSWLSGLPPLPVLDNISITELTLALALGKTLTSKN